MRRRTAAIGLAALLSMSTCLSAQAGWAKWDDVWFYTDSEGNFEKNVLRPSGGRWWWLGEDCRLKTGHEGESIQVEINGVLYSLTLNDNGSVKPECRDQNGNFYDIYDLVGPGTGGGTNSHASEWREVQESANHPHAWIYNDETGRPVGAGVQEINGFLFYFDSDGEIKSKDSTGLRDGHYIEPYDYIMAVDKWVPYDGNWYYFDEKGDQVTGTQVIDGTAYDFGTEGYLDGSEVSFPLVTSVKLGAYPEKAYVGDVVEIPFTVEVEQRIATSSNATASNAAEVQYMEADYEMFKKFYAVGNENRYNSLAGKYESDVNPKNYDKSAIDRRYEIDWDRQVIRISIDRVGTVYGTLRIPNMYYGTSGSGIFDADGFIINCYYPEDMPGEEKVADILTSMDTADSVNALKAQDNEELKEALLDSEIAAQIKEMEYMYNQENRIKTYVKADGARTQINSSAVRVTGLGLLAGKESEIGLCVNNSSEKMPLELINKNTVALDLKVLHDGREKNNLEIPAIITLPRPRAIAGDSFGLYHIQDGEAEEVPYIYNSETKAVTFTADRFSIYVFAEERTPGSDGGGNSSDGSSDSDSHDNTAFTESKSAGVWKRDDRGWWFKNPDGSYPMGIWQLLSYQQKAAWYHFDAEGYMQTGWFKDTDGRWYYLNPDADGTCGGMVTGWRQIDGFWYYFNEQSDGYLGALVTDGTSPDGCRVDEQGRWVP